MTTTAQGTPGAQDTLIGSGYLPDAGIHQKHVAQVTQRAETPKSMRTTCYWVTCSCGDVWIASRESILRVRRARPYYWDTDRLDPLLTAFHMDGLISTRTYHAAIRWHVWPAPSDCPSAPPRPLTVGAFRCLDDASIVQYVQNIGVTGLAALRQLIGQGQE